MAGNTANHKFISVFALIQPLGNAGDGAGGEQCTVDDLGVGNAAGKEAGVEPAVAEFNQLVFSKQIAEKPLGFGLGAELEDHPHQFIGFGSVPIHAGSTLS